MFNYNPLFFSDGYKLGHRKMLAPGTTKLAGSWIPRTLKHAPKGIKKIVCFGHQLVWKYINFMFITQFFFTKERAEYERALVSGDNSFSGPTLAELKQRALSVVKDFSAYLGVEYDGSHFEALFDLGYLPVKVKALPEGTATNPNIPHLTIVNTVDGFAWLTLYLETVFSNLSWKLSTAATIAKQYRMVTEHYVTQTDRDNTGLVDYMCHDFSARGLSGTHDMVFVALGHAASFKGSDSMIAIPATREFYNEGPDYMPINSVNASEHSVSTTKIFTVGECQMIKDWIEIYSNGILSIVADTFNLWTLITEYLPANKEAIMNRKGKLVIRPDSGVPEDIICGLQDVKKDNEENAGFGGLYIWDKNRPGEYIPKYVSKAEAKGVIELLWDIFGGTINEQGYKVLDPHIGAIYGDSITPDRQVEIYERLKAKGFAATNIVLGVGSFTYEFLTRDTMGFAAKGVWFEVEKNEVRKGYGIYKDPATDSGNSKKSLKGPLKVYCDGCVEPGASCNKNDLCSYPNCNIIVKEECSVKEEDEGLLQVIFEDGKFYNQTTFEQVRSRLKEIKW